MTLEALALFALAAALPLGFAVEYLQLARWLFGKPAGHEPSVFRLGWLAMGSYGLFQGAGWVYGVLVPRDPSYFVSRFVYFLAATMAIGFAFYAAREVGHLLRARQGR